MTRPQPPYAYVRTAYGVTPIPGERVRFSDGREGVIARRASYDQYVWVKFGGQKHALPCHPTDLTYLDQAGPGDAPHQPDAPIPPGSPVPPPRPPRTPEDGQRPSTPEDGQPVTTR